MAKKRQQQKYDYLVKIVIIGDTAVGKTNVLLRYVNQQYKMSHISTIGVDFKIKTIDIDGVKIKMQIWDTAGQQRFKTITQTYYKGAAAVILVYSVTDKKTFHSLENWIKQINDSQPQNICKIIVGNKCDCVDSQRQITFEEGQGLAKKYNLPFIETSAKDNYNIQQLFRTVGTNIKKKLFDNTASQTKKDNQNIRIHGTNKNEKAGKDCSC